MTSHPSGECKSRGGTRRKSRCFAARSRRRPSCGQCGARRRRPPGGRSRRARRSAGRGASPRGGYALGWSRRSRCPAGVRACCRGARAGRCVVRRPSRLVRTRSRPPAGRSRSGAPATPRPTGHAPAAPAASAMILSITLMSAWPVTTGTVSASQAATSASLPVR